MGDQPETGQMQAAKPQRGEGFGWLRLWGPFLLLSTGLGWLANRFGVPAAWMVGPMVAAILWGVFSGRRPRLHPALFGVAQAVVGVLVASMFRASDLPVIVHHLPAVLVVAAGSLLVSLLMGFLFSRLTGVDTLTAVMGSMPGGASSMVAMSTSLSADAKLVAVMQYIRVIVVVLAASAVTRWLAGQVPPASSSLPAVSHTSGYAGLLTLVVALAGGYAGKRLRLPAGQLLGAMLAGTWVNLTGWVPLVIPPALSATAYALLGMYVGLMFDKPALRYAGQLLPYMAGSTLALVVMSGSLGWAMARWTRETMLTSFLATSPGGLDSVSLMAIGGGANLALVVSLQTIRMFSIVLFGPFILRWLAKRRVLMQVTSR
ncbi:MAG: AbrB family transcriptional regulator [Alicyclobacillus sp.]|nr:AbrB family transcriptional regulator [Alicyclobacillus sp.]